MTKNNNNNNRRKISVQRHRRSMRVFENIVAAVVMVILVCALGQGNLRKSTAGEDDYRPEGAASADISESSTAVQTDSADTAEIARYDAELEVIQPQQEQYIQYVNYTSPELASKGNDIYDATLYAPANVTDDRYFQTSLLIGDSRAETLGLYSDLPDWDACAAKDLNIETVRTKKLVDGSDGNTYTVPEMLSRASYENIYISFGVEELSWYNERFVSAYKDLLDEITTLQPSANIYVMSLLPVSAELSAVNQVYNNPGVDRLNSLMMDMCNAYDHVIYLDVASSVAENGVLPEDAGIDGIHCSKEYCQRVLTYIRNNTYVRK